MKVKTIKKILAQEHHAWTASIEDTEVRDAARQQSFITGGAVTSLFLGEEVNDFDIYFKTKEAARAVIGYYVDRWNKHHNRKVQMKEENDRIKVFIRSAGIAEEKEDGSKDKGKYHPTFLSANAITLSDKVQLCVRFYGSPAEVHKNFDFVHATCYYDPYRHELVTPPEALQAILSKTLDYVGSKYPLASIIRTRKFIKRGWSINAGQFVKMAMQLNSMDLTNVETLEDQLTGVDFYYMQGVIAAIKEKLVDDPNFKIDALYMGQVIDKIFDEEPEEESEEDE